MTASSTLTGRQHPISGSIVFDGTKRIEQNTVGPKLLPSIRQVSSYVHNVQNVVDGRYGLWENIS